MPVNVGAVFDGFITVSNDLGSVTWRPNAIVPTTLEQGTSTNQADLVFSDTRTLTTGSGESLDLTGTALNNAFGAALALAKVKAIYIKSKDTNTTTLTVGNVTNSIQLGFGATTQSWAIPPGGVFLVTAPQSGWTVTAGTGDLLRIVNASGASADFDIIVIGTSA